jgi:LysR family transcriptional regulator, glycine cleavage system transcriptional activator
MTQATHLRSLQALEMAVRKGSLNAAAQALGITPAAVGQRIKALEDYLGLDLLVRGRSGIRPTRVLEGALAHLNAAFREIDTVAQILDFQRVHEIHIIADTDWAELWLKPRLLRYKEAHPNTRFCVNGIGDVPLRLGEADCEVWFGEPRDAATGHFLFRDYLVPVGSPEIAARLSKWPKGKQLEGAPLLHLDCFKGDPDAIGWPEWVKRHGQRTTAPGRGIRYRWVVHALEPAYSTAGVMLCGLAMVEALLKAGKLSLPFPIAQGAWTGHGYCLRFRESALRRQQAVQFRDWVLEESAATANWLRARTAEV